LVTERRSDARSGHGGLYSFQEELRRARIEGKNVSALDRGMSSRDSVYSPERSNKNSRSAMCRKGFAWRRHRQALKRLRESLLRDDDIAHNKADANPVSEEGAQISCFRRETTEGRTLQPGVSPVAQNTAELYSSRRGRVDDCSSRTENRQERSDALHSCKTA
jgi:hypothetical protein